MKNILNGLSDSAASWSEGRSVLLQMSEAHLKVIMDPLADLVIPRRHVRLWGITHGTSLLRDKEVIRIC